MPNDDFVSINAELQRLRDIVAAQNVEIAQAWNAPARDAEPENEAPPNDREYPDYGHFHEWGLHGGQFTIRADQFQEIDQLVRDGGGQSVRIVNDDGTLSSVMLAGTNYNIVANVSPCNPRLLTLSPVNFMAIMFHRLYTPLHLRMGGEGNSSSSSASSDHASVPQQAVEAIEMVPVQVPQPSHWAPVPQPPYWAPLPAASVPEPEPQTATLQIAAVPEEEEVDGDDRDDLMVFTSENLGALLDDADTMQMNAFVEQGILHIEANGEVITGVVEIGDNVIFTVNSVQSLARLGLRTAILYLALLPQAASYSTDGTTARLVTYDGVAQSSLVSSRHGLPLQQPWIGWIIFFTIMTIIVTGIIQLYLAFKRKRTEIPPLPMPSPPPLPPPVEAPGHDVLALALPDKIYIFPTGHVYHTSEKCYKGGKEYNLCKICKRRNDEETHVHVENAIQGNAARRASSSSL